MSTNGENVADRVHEQVHIRLAEKSDLTTIWPNMCTRMQTDVQNRVWDIVHTESQRRINHVLELLDLLESEDQAYASANRG